MPRNYNWVDAQTPKQRANIQPRTAEDTKGETVTVSSKIDRSDRDELDSLPGDRSWKIRQAIREYIQKNRD
jgi:hypothetical protein